MRRLLTACLLLSSLIPSPLRGGAGVGYHLSIEGAGVGYRLFIEMPRASLSGICVFATTAEGVQGAVLNEFGLTILAFTWLPEKNRVKLQQVTGLLDHWYIRRQLRKDLPRLFHSVQQGRGAYRNERRGLTYVLTPLTDDDNETNEETHDTEE